MSLCLVTGLFSGWSLPRESDHYQLRIDNSLPHVVTEEEARERNWRVSRGELIEDEELLKSASRAGVIYDGYFPEFDAPGEKQQTERPSLRKHSALRWKDGLGRRTDRATGGAGR